MAERQALADFLVTAGIANSDAGTYADRLVTENVKTVAEFKALKEEDLKDPKIGMKLGDLSRLRPHLTAQPQRDVQALTSHQVLPKKDVKLHVEDYLGYIGPVDDLQSGFSGKIPYFADLSPAMTKRVASILAQPSKDQNKYVLANFDFSGIGKSTLFKQLAKLAGAHYVRFDASLGSPLALVYNKAEEVVSKHFQDRVAETSTLVSKLTPIFRLAFIECLKLTSCALSSSHSLLEETDMRNGPLDEALLENGKLDEEWRAAMNDLMPLLKGTPIIILFDELQKYGTSLKSIKRDELPKEVVFKRSSPEEFEASDLYLPIIYECLGELAQAGAPYSISFALAGTYGSLKSLLVHSPCSNHPAFEEMLPLKQFDNERIAQVWDYYWRFPSLSPVSRTKIFSQINGPPRVTEYMMRALLDISAKWKIQNRRVEDIKENDLQEVVDLAYNNFLKNMNKRLVQLDQQFYTYKLLAVFPLLYGGEISNGEILFKDKKSYGFKFLQEASDKLMETGLVRIFYSWVEQCYSLCRPYPFIERSIAMQYFSCRPTLLHVISLTLSNKPKCFEFLLAREFCVPGCKLMQTIADTMVKSKIVDFNPKPLELNPDLIEFGELTDFPNPQQTYTYIMTVDDTHTRLVGEHKIDVFVPVTNGRIFIQATTMNRSGVNHDPQTNLKARGFFKAMSQHVPAEPQEPYVLIFACLYDFKVSRDTQKQMDNLSSGNIICLILKGNDFDDTRYPFNLLREENVFTNPSSVETIAKSIENMAGTWRKELLSPALKRRKLNVEEEDTMQL